MALKILGIHADCCQLGGHTRAFLMFMDIFKSLGYNIHIVARTDQPSTQQVQMPILDPSKGKPLFTNVNVTATMKLAHHSLRDIRKYQPLRYVTSDDISAHDIPVVYWGDHFLTAWAPEVIAKMQEVDYIFNDTEMYIKMESDLDIAHKHIQFVHFPNEMSLPVLGKEPEMVWANSSFTQSWIRIRWGYNNPEYTKIDEKYATIQIPKQIFQAEIVNPPIYTEDYKNDYGFSDRRYDIVMFARLGEDKFTIDSFLDKHFKLLSLGAQTPINPMSIPPPPTPKGTTKVDLTPRSQIDDRVFNPKGELHKNLTMQQINQFLKQAKDYVHGKGFGTTQSGGASLPEHFGISPCEAASSGCALVVPRAGGIWTDIAEHGKYALGYSSLEELKSHVEKLTKNREEWEKWHERALKGVQRFDTEKIKARVKELLN